MCDCVKLLCRHRGRHGRGHARASVLAGSGCTTRRPRRLKKQDVYFSQCWRPNVRGHGTSAFGSRGEPTSWFAHGRLPSVSPDGEERAVDTVRTPSPPGTSPEPDRPQISSRWGAELRHGAWGRTPSPWHHPWLPGAPGQRWWTHSAGQGFKRCELSPHDPGAPVTPRSLHRCGGRAPRGLHDPSESLRPAHAGPAASPRPGAPSSAHRWCARGSQPRCSSPGRRPSHPAIPLRQAQGGRGGWGRGPSWHVGAQHRGHCLTVWSVQAA